MKLSKLVTYLNFLEIIVLCCIVVAASMLQFFFNELPCPLCLLQRVSLLLIATGIFFNLTLSKRPRHYALSLLGSLFTAAVSIRQILLHILPGSSSYGSDIFGFSMYVWSFIIAVITIAWSTLMLFQDKQFYSHANRNNRQRSLAIIAYVVLCSVISLNVVTTYMECGIDYCAENPTHYLHTI